MKSGRFCYAKDKNVAMPRPPRKALATFGRGRRSMPIPSSSCRWIVGERDALLGIMPSWTILKARLANRVQLTTDGHSAYLKAVEEAFGALTSTSRSSSRSTATHHAGSVEDRNTARRMHRREKKPIIGNPGPGPHQHVVCRAPEPHDAHEHAPLHATDECLLKEARQPLPRAVALLHVLQLGRIHKTLRVTPAMASGLTDHLWTMEEIIGLMDEVAPKPGRPKTYKKRIAEGI